MLVVVGGHSRNIGKTSVAAGLIRHLRDRRWAALKITQYGLGVCSHHGEACGCETEPDHPFALSEEYEPSGTDSGRFLAAGAERSFWLRTPAGQLSDRTKSEQSPAGIVPENVRWPGCKNRDSDRPKGLWRERRSPRGDSAP